MASVFRESKNILASLLYFLQQELITDGLDSTWTALFGFKNAYSTTLPVICVRNGITLNNWAEMGSTLVTKHHNVIIDIFARDDMERFDIKDWIIDNIRDGFIYYTHTVDGSGTITRVADGRVTILTLTEQEINLNTDKSQLDEHDKNRYLINLVVTTGEVS